MLGQMTSSLNKEDNRSSMQFKATNIVAIPKSHFQLHIIIYVIEYGILEWLNATDVWVSDDAVKNEHLNDFS